MFESWMMPPTKAVVAPWGSAVVVGNVHLAASPTGRIGMMPVVNAEPVAGHGHT